MLNLHRGKKKRILIFVFTHAQMCVTEFTCDNFPYCATTFSLTSNEKSKLFLYTSTVCILGTFPSPVKRYHRH